MHCMPCFLRFGCPTSEFFTVFGDVSCESFSLLPLRLYRLHVKDNIFVLPLVIHIHLYTTETQNVHSTNHYLSKCFVHPNFS